RRPGSPARTSPSMATVEKGSGVSPPAACSSAATRSRTRPWSGPYTRTMGRRGSGRATKASTSLAGTAVTAAPSGSREEKRRQARTDLLGGNLGCAILGVAHSANICEALLGGVDGNARERLFGQHDAILHDIVQLIGDVEGQHLRNRTARALVDNRIKGTDIGDK